MRIIDGKEVAAPKQILEENESDGRVVCCCGHEYTYDLLDKVNSGQWFGFLVPICPNCETIPQSDTRRMDL
jgi:hypothetical protein